MAQMCNVSLAALCVAIAACSSTRTPLPSNASIGSGKVAWPAPISLPAEAAPRILAMHFSTLDLVRPMTWRAEFATTSNAAAMVVRTDLFAIDVPKIGTGRFAFTLHVYDVPPIFLRAYRLRVIARNAQGAAEEDAPLRIR